MHRFVIAHSISPQHIISCIHYIVFPHSFHTHDIIDIDECLAGLSTCGHNSICMNTIGSYSCHCNKGFTTHNISFGCHAMQNFCPDGTICDKNAVCKHVGGLRVRFNCHIALFNCIHLKRLSLFIKCSSNARVKSALAAMVQCALRIATWTDGQITV